MILVEKFVEDHTCPKCNVCGSKMYVTDRGFKILIYHCSSDEARFWDFPRGSKDQGISKKHWEDSKLETREQATVV